MKTSPNQACPCCSGHKFKKCCRPLILGAPAPGAEDLMRSRFAAYATGAVSYIMQTTHPNGPHFKADAVRWAAEIERFCTQTTFERLVVREVAEDGDGAEVEFEAHLRREGEDCSFAERSVFARVDGRWLYRAGSPRVLTSGIAGMAGASRE
jgi:SEC-C motif-containing protein